MYYFCSHYSILNSDLKHKVMTTYLAKFSKPVEWVTYRDKWDEETKTWIENGKEILHSETEVEFYSASEAKRFI